MDKQDDRAVKLSDDLPSAIQFLNVAADNEVRSFLRRLPMVGGNDGDKITLSDLIYEMRLLPFVMDAWKNTSGKPGVPGRLKQLSLVYHTAEANMQKLTGEKRRLKRMINLPSFLEIYGSEGLP